MIQAESNPQERDEYKIWSKHYVISWIYVLQGFIPPYVSSITSMETGHVLEATKDAGGASVIEAFLH